MLFKTKIRVAIKEDIIQLINLCHMHAIFEESDYNSSGKEEEELSKHLFSVNPSFHCLVAENDMTLMGYATYMQQFSTWNAKYYIYMDCLFFSEESRSYGLGEEFIEKIKNHARQLDINTIQ